MFFHDASELLAGGDETIVAGFLCYAWRFVVFPRKLARISDLASFLSLLVLWI